MNTWILLAFLLATWALWFIHCVVEAGLSDVRRGGPDDERHGVSLFPVIPLFPLVAWGVALLADRFFSPWGTYVVAGIHAILGIAWGISMFRNVRELKRIEIAQ